MANKSWIWIYSMITLHSLMLTVEFRIPPPQGSPLLKTKMFNLNF